jgi:hypothetical protein
MLKWNARDWASAICGWLAAIAAVVFLPDSLWRLFVIFATGFLVAWIVRLLIPH